MKKTKKKTQLSLDKSLKPFVKSRPFMLIGETEELCRTRDRIYPPRVYEILPSAFPAAVKPVDYYKEGMDIDELLLATDCLVKDLFKLGGNSSAFLQKLKTSKGDATHLECTHRDGHLICRRVQCRAPKEKEPNEDEHELAKLMREQAEDMD